MAAGVSSPARNGRGRGDRGPAVRPPAPHQPADGGAVRATWYARIHGDHLRNVIHAGAPEHLDQHIAFREEDLAADGAPSAEAGRDLTGEAP